MQGAHDGQVVSGLMDGELGVEEAEREIARLKTDGALRQNWDTFHLIGDAMRGSAGDSTGGTGFCSRFSERLALEPTVLAPRKAAPRSRVQAYLLPIAASVAAVAVVGWVTLSTTSGKPDAVNNEMALVQPLQQKPSQPMDPKVLTLQPGVVAEQSAEPRAVPDAPQQSPEVAIVAEQHMQEFMLAHQGISPTTQFQGVTPYIRTVSSASE